MAKYHLLTTHLVAHIEPTLVHGTEADWYPSGNIRGVAEPNNRSRATCANFSAPYYYASWRFDRGASPNAITTVLLAGMSYHASAVEFAVQADSDINFGSPTTLVDWSAQTLVAPGVYTFASNTEQYVRLIIRSTGTTVVEVGAISFCTSHNLSMRQISLAERGDNRRENHAGVLSSFLFKRVVTDDATDIVTEWAAEFVTNSTNSSIQGRGCNGGLLKENGFPLALAFFDQDADTVADQVLYGPGAVTTGEYAANYTDLRVEVLPYRIGELYVP